ncbi:MAG: hypothetical protein RLN77_09395 [Rhodospirillales bacterium]
MAKAVEAPDPGGATGGKRKEAGMRPGLKTGIAGLAASIALGVMPLTAAHAMSAADCAQLKRLAYECQAQDQYYKGTEPSFRACYQNYMNAYNAGCTGGGGGGYSGGGGGATGIDRAQAVIGAFQGFLQGMIEMERQNMIREQQRQAALQDQRLREEGERNAEAARRRSAQQREELQSAISDTLARCRTENAFDKSAPSGCASDTNPFGLKGETIAALNGGRPGKNNDPDTFYRDENNVIANWRAMSYDSKAGKYCVVINFVTCLPDEIRKALSDPNGINLQTPDFSRLIYTVEQYKAIARGERVQSRGGIAPKAKTGTGDEGVTMPSSGASKNPFE